MVSHAVLLQVMWVGVVWVGIAASLVVLLESFGDRDHAVRSGGPAMRRRVQLATIAIRNEAVRLATQIAFLGLALIVPMAPSPEPVSLCCAVTGYVLMALSALIAANTLVARHGRQTLIREALEQMRGGD